MSPVSIVKQRKMVSIKQDAAARLKCPSAKAYLKKFLSLKTSGVYKDWLEYLTNEASDDLIVDWLSEMTSCISHFDQSSQPFVLDFLKIRWNEKGKEVEEAMSNFIKSLLMGHVYFTYSILRNLFEMLLPEVLEAHSDLMMGAQLGQFSNEEKRAYRKVLNLIKVIFLLVPMCHGTIVKLATKMYPYYKFHTRVHLVYSNNLLVLGEMIPKLRSQFFEIIITNMLVLDLHLPRVELQGEYANDYEEEAIFEMEMESDNVSKCKLETETCKTHPLGNSLDHLMSMVLQYIHAVVHGSRDMDTVQSLIRDDQITILGCRCSSHSLSDDPKSTVTMGCECKRTCHNFLHFKDLFSDLRVAFMKIILPTHSSSHVQFLFFYMVAIRPSVLSEVLEWLMFVFEDPSHVKDVRRNAVAYIGSLLARGQFVTFSHLHSCLSILSSWCTNYIEKQKGQSTNYEDLQLHFPFYVACQTLFYTFAFRYEDYTKDSDRISAGGTLHFNVLINCPLNPLRYCCPSVVAVFAEITNRFQIVYCYSITEKNSCLTVPLASQSGRFNCEVPLTLDSFFPFDPCPLKRVQNVICNHYRHFCGLPEECEVGEGESQIEDMSYHMESTSLTPESMSFSGHSSKWLQNTFS